MMTVDQAKRVLHMIAKAHHEYEQTELKGIRDENWDLWYAQYFINLILDLSRKTDLEMIRHILHDTTGEGEMWFDNAAKALVETLSGVNIQQVAIWPKKSLDK